MLDLTLPQLAGTFVGIWGLAQAFSRALGKIIGGGLLDLGRSLTDINKPLQAFSIVFIVECITILIAIKLLKSLNTGKFKQETKSNFETLFLSELD